MEIKYPSSEATYGLQEYGGSMYLASYLLQIIGNNCSVCIQVIFAVNHIPLLHSLLIVLKIFITVYASICIQCFTRCKKNAKYLVNNNVWTTVNHRCEKSVKLLMVIYTIYAKLPLIEIKIPFSYKINVVQITMNNLTISLSSFKAELWPAAIN